MAAHIIAVIVIVGFFVVMLAVLLGFVNVTEPTIAKLVGALFGYLTALLNPVIYRYFGTQSSAKGDVP